MYKKIIISLLLIALSNYLACTSFSVVTKESKVNDIENGKYSGEMFLITVNSSRYHFDEWHYYVKNDTLFGNGFEESVVGKIPFKGAIPVEDIDYIEIKKADTLATIGLVLGISAAILLIWGLIWSASLTNSLSSQ